MHLLDSRRLTGPNLIWDQPGAILDVAVPEGMPTAQVDAAIAAWEQSARKLLAAVGWEGERTGLRRWEGGFSLALTAPIDGLYSAVDLAEQAWHRLADGQPEPEAATVAHLRAKVAAEADPRLLVLKAAADARGLSLRADGDRVTLGMGVGSRTWPQAELPEPDAVDWNVLHDIPVALVTGTNGKSTTVRLVAAMAEAAGQVVGLSSTEWVMVAGEILDRGDWSGPGGARMVLADLRPTVAVLEAARGGLLRRGLAVERATVAAVTNLAEDHLGDAGVPDLAALADLKFVVTRVADQVVLNADDPISVARAASLRQRVTYFGLDPAAPRLAAHLAGGGRACLLEGDRLVLRDGGAAPTELARVAEVPIALGGAARYNLANALCAAAVGLALGLPAAAVRAGLTSFENRPDSNPGRMNRFDLGGATVIVDYAHNPHGLRAALDTVAHLPATRRLLSIGQAGDRSDEAIRELAQLALTMAPDRVVVKELPKHLRGRLPGEVPAILADELARLGLPAGAIEVTADDLAATRAALAWARPGDLILLLVHSGRSEVLGLIEGLAAGGWRPGEAIDAA